GNTLPRCLVGDERRELRERPRVQLCSLGLAGPCPGADAGQVFQTNPSLGALGLSDDLFGYAVVHVFGEPGFFARTLAEQALGRFSSFLLQAPTKTQVLLPDACNLLTGRDGAVTGGGD